MGTRSKNIKPSFESIVTHWRHVDQIQEADAGSLEPYAERFFDFVLAEEPRRQVSADDVLDALAAFVTSSASNSQLAGICGVPASEGLSLLEKN
jgi:predicted RNase H-like nuclease